MSALEPIFARRDGAYAPSGHARGPWDPGAQHGGAPAALLAREIERLDPGPAMIVARITYEFLAPVPLAPLVPAARVVRPGRRFQLVEAELGCGGETVLRARAVRLRRGNVDLPMHALHAVPAPETPPEACRPTQYPPDGPADGFHRTGMELRFAPGFDWGKGPGRGWFRLARPLVDGEEPSPLQRLVATADFGNGASRLLEFDEYLFVNTDLTVHAFREPLGEWIFLDAVSLLDTTGVGLATSTLFDKDGVVGIAAQSLLVERR